MKRESFHYSFSRQDTAPDSLDSSSALSCCRQCSGHLVPGHQIDRSNNWALLHTTMTSLRRFTCHDLFLFNNVNLDYFTETVGLPISTGSTFSFGCDPPCPAQAARHTSITSLSAPPACSTT